jgi:hypothetical protein
MKVHYSDQPFLNAIENGVFLAGPTPRDKGVPSWRPKSIEILKDLNFEGTVLIPERNFEVKADYTDQVEWERTGLMGAKAIVFWVPRDLETMPAFTTNVEFGYWLAKTPSKCFYGRPPESPKNRYLDWLYQLELPDEPIYDTLETLLDGVVKFVKDLQ